MWGDRELNTLINASNKMSNDNKFVKIGFDNK